jgi:transcriptional regulator with XRE-family HTH domain
MNICDKIKILRKIKCFSQIQLSKITGLTQQHISKIESGRITPNLHTLQKILDALGSEIDFIPKQKAPAAQVPSRSATALMEQPSSEDANPKPGHAVPI